MAYVQHRMPCCRIKGIKKRDLTDEELSVVRDTIGIYSSDSYDINDNIVNTLNLSLTYSTEENKNYIQLSDNIAHADLWGNHYADQIVYINFAGNELYNAKTLEFTFNIDIRNAPAPNPGGGGNNDDMG